MPTIYPLPSITINQVEINIKDLPDFEGFGEEFERQFSKQMKKIGYEAKSFWQSEAGRRLTRSREAYQKSITVSIKADDSVSLQIGGRGGNATSKQKWLAMAVESGIPSYDLKPGFLKGGMMTRVIPLDTKDQGRIFRTVKAVGQEHKWIHPGLKGLNLVNYVVEELNNNIIPKYTEIAFNEALKKF